MKITTVVVTYKRPKLLDKCLNSILNISTFKSYNVHVVVNSDDADTLEVIRTYEKAYPNLISYEVHNNSGPAGGFYYGVKHFSNSNSDYVWLMDDDVIPSKNCLEELVEQTKNSQYIYPKVYTPYGEEIKTFGWSGVLLSKAIVENVGLPIKEFFYWSEDTEYLQNRITRKFKILPSYCETATVEHLYNRSDTRIFWYYYYTVRNTLYYRTRIFPLNSRGIKRLILMFAGFFYRILFKEPQKIKKIYMMFLGTYHGLTGKIGKIERFHI